MMKQTDIVRIAETVLNSGKAINRTYLRFLQMRNCYNTLDFPSLAFHEYRFKDGPFKGHRFISTAPNTKWLNKYDNLRVIFLDGKYKGLETLSIICFDRQIEKVEKEWQPLLSISRTTWSKISAAGFRTRANRT